MRLARAAARLAAVAAWMPSLAGAAPECAVTEKDLVGSWGKPSGAAFFEEFALELDDGQHVFNSWLHQRPEMSGGHWTFAHCRLHIEAAHDPAMVFDYTVSMSGHNRLVLRDSDGRAVFRRLGAH